MPLPAPPPGDRERLAGAPAYALLLLAFALHLTLGSTFQQAYLPFGIAYGQILFFFGIPWLAAGALGQPGRRFFALSPPAPWAWPWVVVAAVAGFLLAGGLNAFNQWLVGEDLARFFDSTRVLRGRPFSEQVAVALCVTFLAPLGEEFLFRGYLLRVFRARYGTLAGLLVSSALFAAMHLNPASFVALLALGLLFGLLRILSGSLLPALLAHAIQNGVTAVVVLLSEAPESEDVDLAVALLFVAGALPLLWLSLTMVRRIAAPPSNEPTLDPSAGGLELARVRKPIGIWLGAALLSSALVLVLA